MSPNPCPCVQPLPTACPLQPPIDPFCLLQGTLEMGSGHESSFFQQRTLSVVSAPHSLLFGFLL